MFQGANRLMSTHVRLKCEILGSFRNFGALYQIFWLKFLPYSESASNSASNEVCHVIFGSKKFLSILDQRGTPLQLFKISEKQFFLFGVAIKNYK